MLVGRAIVAVFLALAVALLPASGGAAFAAKMDTTHTHALSVELAAVETGATPCDHGSSAVDDCGSVSICALKCFTYVGTRLPSLLAPFTAVRLATGFTTENVDSRGGIPPFRPPRA